MGIPGRPYKQVSQVLVASRVTPRKSRSASAPPLPSHESPHESPHEYMVTTSEFFWPMMSMHSGSESTSVSTCVCGCGGAGAGVRVRVLERGAVFARGAPASCSWRATAPHPAWAGWSSRAPTPEPREAGARVRVRVWARVRVRVRVRLPWSTCR